MRNAETAADVVLHASVDSAPGHPTTAHVVPTTLVLPSVRHTKEAVAAVLHKGIKPTND